MQDHNSVAMAQLERRSSLLRPSTSHSTVSSVSTTLSIAESMRKSLPPLPGQRPVSEAMTTSTRRLSFSSSMTKKTIKYATGKYAGIELIPQPSELAEDPLNWPRWRKELNFAALIVMTALVGSMKTVFLSVNSDVATRYNVSYTAAVSLTAIPLMMSAVTGMASLIVSRIWGKRPVYLASTLLIFIGVVWNTSTLNSFGQNVTARIFQGLGWGAFDTLLLGSIQDTFFEHERDPRVLAYYAISVASTWGPPLLGGLASRTDISFTLQFKIISSFMAPAILLMALGAPETTFDRNAYHMSLPASSPSLPWAPFSWESNKQYLMKVKPAPYKADSIHRVHLLQAPRAMITPTILSLFVVTLLPHVALWSFTSSFSLLFSTMPFMLSTTSVGTLMTGPFLLATATAAALSLPFFLTRFTPKFNSAVIGVGTVVAVTGLLGFGMYAEGCMASADDSPTTGSMWTLDGRGADLSFPVVSFLIGLLAAGSMILDATIRPLIQRSAQFTSSNLTACFRNIVDMTASLTCWRNFFAGVFILSIPNAIWSWDGLRVTSMGLALTQLFVGGVLGFIWWYWDEAIRRMDGMVLGLVNLDDLKGQGSFFDLD